MRLLALSLTAMSGLAALAVVVPSAASAQIASGQVIVYGTDPCPRSSDDEVVVCVRRPETERYRIPEDLRTAGPRQTRESWSNKSRALMTAGNTGPNTCSSVGPGGQTGCLLQEIRENEAAVQEAQEEATPPE